MPAPKVRSDYEGLKVVSQTFARQADVCQHTLQMIQAAKTQLQAGDWIGVGASAFYREMDDTVLPALQRLVQALEQAGMVTGQISAVMHQAEEAAARCFQAVATTPGPGGPIPIPYPNIGTAAGSGAMNRFTGGTNLSADALAGLTPEALGTVVQGFGPRAADADGTTLLDKMPTLESVLGVAAVAIPGAEATFAATGPLLAALGGGQAPAPGGPGSDQLNKILNDPSLTIEDKVLATLMQVAQRDIALMNASLQQYMVQAMAQGAVQQSANALSGGLIVMATLVQNAVNQAARPTMIQEIEALQKQISFEQQTISQIMDSYNRVSQDIVRSIGP